jgi:hypothetical protein
LTHKQQFIEFLQTLTGSVVVFGQEIHLTIAYKELSFIFLEFNQVTQSYPIVQSTSIIIFEDQWLHKGEIVQSRIKALLGKTTRVHGRKTKVRRIDQATANTFLKENHLQGALQAKFRYGLYLGLDLVSVALFNSGRNMPRLGPNYRSYELTRYATDKGMHIVGGLNKLLQAFVGEHAPSDIMTYTDLAWGKGVGFQKIGFQEKDILRPNTMYLNSYTLERYSIQQAKGLESTLVPIQTLGSMKLIKYQP